MCIPELDVQRSTPIYLVSFQPPVSVCAYARTQMVTLLPSRPLTQIMRESWVRFPDGRLIRYFREACQCFWRLLHYALSASGSRF